MLERHNDEIIRKTDKKILRGYESSIIRKRQIDEQDRQENG